MPFEINSIRIPQVASTNAHMQELLQQQDLPEGTLIITDHQWAGRGIGENSWESEPGMNLTFSILLRPRFLQASDQFLLNMAVSVAVANTVSGLLDPKSVKIKWPNDIYIFDRKVCGMLIQHSVLGEYLEYSIVGIGLNVNQVVFVSNAPNPISLRLVSGIKYEPEKVLDLLAENLAYRYDQLLKGQTRMLTDEYHSLLYRIGERKLYEIKGREISGTIEGVNVYGQLLITAEDGKTYDCDLKEVVFR